MSDFAFGRSGLTRLLLSILAALLVLAATRDVAAAASQTFVLPPSSGYGVSDCLGKEPGCGEVVASAWCEAHGYARPLAYGKAEDQTTGSIGTKLAAAAPAKIDPESYVVTCGD